MNEKDLTSQKMDSLDYASQCRTMATSIPELRYASNLTDEERKNIFRIPGWDHRILGADNRTYFWVSHFNKTVITIDGPGILRNFDYGSAIKEIIGLQVEMYTGVLVSYNFGQVRPEERIDALVKFVVAEKLPSSLRLSAALLAKYMLNALNAFAQTRLTEDMGLSETKYPVAAHPVANGGTMGYEAGIQTCQGMPQVMGVDFNREKENSATGIAQLTKKSSI